MLMLGRELDPHPLPHPPVPVSRVVSLVRCVTVSQYIASRDAVSGSVYLVLLAVFAIMPLLDDCRLEETTRSAMMVMTSDVHEVWTSREVDQHIVIIMGEARMAAFTIVKPRVSGVSSRTDRVPSRQSTQNA